MSTPTKSPVPVAAVGSSPGGASDRSQSPGRIRNLVERSSTFLQKRRQSFRRNRQENASGSGSSPGGGSAPQGQGVVSRTVSKTVAALKWTPIPTTNIWGYIPLVLLILLIGFSLIGMWTILQITVLRDWWN